MAAAEVVALQRLAGNQATAIRLEISPSASRRPGRQSGRSVQRLDIYGRAAARGNTASGGHGRRVGRRITVRATRPRALSAVVSAMTARGELDPRLLRTSGDGDLWQIGDIGELGPRSRSARLVR